MNFNSSSAAAYHPFPSSLVAHLYCHSTTISIVACVWIVEA